MTYYSDIAARVFQDAGGDPVHSTALATWAETARDRGRSGVIVGQDGTILAETTRVRGRVSADYVTEQGTKRWGLRSNVRDLAVGAISRQAGQPAIWISTADLTRGAGAFAR
ncbi:hypothetical protein [Microbacterium rhizophilus]|uniref:hypothetical protein n=1 Tax=Microbacterium rhizophilus TaxID=3138934 RepID=UPI0031EC3C28